MVSSFTSPTSLLMSKFHYSKNYDFISCRVSSECRKSITRCTPYHSVTRMPRFTAVQSALPVLSTFTLLYDVLYLLSCRYSNPKYQDQNLMCYHYTTTQFNTAENTATCLTQPGRFYYFISNLEFSC